MSYRILSKINSLSIDNEQLKDRVSEVEDDILTKAPINNPIFTGTVAGISIDKTSLGLNNVDNTRDVDKPLSSAISTALQTYQPLLSSSSNLTLNNLTCNNSLTVSQNLQCANAVATTSFKVGASPNQYNVLTTDSNLYTNKIIYSPTSEALDGLISSIKTNADTASALVLNTYNKTETDAKYQLKIQSNNKLDFNLLSNVPTLTRRTIETILLNNVAPNTIPAAPIYSNAAGVNITNWSAGYTPSFGGNLKVFATIFLMGEAVAANFRYYLLKNGVRVSSGKFTSNAVGVHMMASPLVYIDTSNVTTASTWGIQIANNDVQQRIFVNYDDFCVMTITEY